METYRKVFFWLFIVLGAYLAIMYKHNFNDFFSQIDTFLLDLTGDIGGKFPYYKHGEWYLAPIILIVGILFFILYFIFGVIYYILKGIFWVLGNICVGYAIIGMILIYPFYVVFINLFELFLLLMIKHPSRREIRRVIGRGRIDKATIDSLSGKMMAFSGKLPHEFESQIMTQQLKGLNRFIHAEIAAIKKLRETKIREALAAIN